VITHHIFTHEHTYGKKARKIPVTPCDVRVAVPETAGGQLDDHASSSHTLCIYVLVVVAAATAAVDNALLTAGD
jgi:hypothetical protein